MRYLDLLGVGLWIAWSWHNDMSTHREPSMRYQGKSICVCTATASILLQSTAVPFGPPRFLLLVLLIWAKKHIGSGASEALYRAHPLTGCWVVGKGCCTARPWWRLKWGGELVGALEQRVETPRSLPRRSPMKLVLRLHQFRMIGTNLNWESLILSLVEGLRRESLGHRGMTRGWSTNLLLEVVETVKRRSQPVKILKLSATGGRIIVVWNLRRPGQPLLRLAGPRVMIQWLRRDVRQRGSWHGPGSELQRRRVGVTTMKFLRVTLQEILRIRLRRTEVRMRRRLQIRGGRRRTRRVEGTMAMDLRVLLMAMIQGEVKVEMTQLHLKIQWGRVRWGTFYNRGWGLPRGQSLHLAPWG